MYRSTGEVHRIVAWHPVLTDHQAYTYQEISRQSGLPVLAQVLRLEDEIRRSQGWADTRVTSIQRDLLPPRGVLRQGFRCLLEHRDQVHIFGSAFEDWRMMLLMLVAIRMGIQCYIVSEPYSIVPVGYFGDESGWRERLKSWLRPIAYRMYVAALGDGLQGVFTISRLAFRQYMAAGLPSEKLFPFGYFVPLEVQAKSSRDVRARFPATLRLAFVGSLIPIKGLKTLLDAVRVANAEGAEVRLDVYGPGDPERYDFSGRNVRYLGRIPFGQTQRYLRGYDLLVLPSLYDGWGVVVNEALCAGVPALCSDHVGAGVLVETFGAGKIFPSGGEKALAAMLIALSKNIALVDELKSACGSAAEAIQPRRAAAYMLEVFSAAPAARATIPSPWYRFAE